ncbi:hypothetical protein AX17_001794 [Amanita inopinata Kibby_2008]|nr:hypothetical protein AX17_001794 [Amanita inopinata Kibby_2008]
MSLQSGFYTIRNGDKFVGRYEIEDRSLLPKRVLVGDDNIQVKVSISWFDLSISTAHMMALNLEWVVEALSNGRYKLSTGKAPTVAIDNKLFALLMDEDKPEEWVITERPQAGDSMYTVEAASKEEGWIAPTNDEEEVPQIAVRPLIVGPSMPPFFPPTEVFKFERIDRDDD